ncbi:acylphosphatase [soil metagenome]
MIDQQLKADVRGKVQGVGFRYFVRTEAQRLGLTGHVSNERDGSVAVVAEGPPGLLDLLEERLHDGPPGADVQEVRSTRIDAAGNSRRFEIRR